MKLACAFAFAVIAAAILFTYGHPRCSDRSEHGTRIGGAILIAGCP